MRQDAAATTSSSMRTWLAGLWGPSCGTISEATGARLAGVEVRVQGGRGVAVTSRAGQYTLTGVKAGIQTIVATRDGYVFEAAAGVVVDNVLVGALIHDPNVTKARKVATDIVEMLELGRLAYVAGHELTVPDRKRLEVARALATGAKLLLLDEPASGLDYDEMDQTKDIILSIRERGTTILLVEHNMDFVMDLSDRIIVLNYGEKLAEDSPEEIKKNKDVVKAYLGGSLDAEN